ncbi:MAG: hypothetical protein HZB16_15090 [Armatimonadetes bacterium]|nr:hypothetical protein [Armatimonadota bacterium]
MRRLAFLAVLVASMAVAAEDQAFFAIEAETSSTKMLGMPEIKLPPGFQLPAGMQMPPGVMAMMSGAPTRKLNIRLWSPSIAPAGATASVVPPPGLKQGDRLNLELYRPRPEQTGPETPGVPAAGTPGQMPDMTIKLYWGSSKTVKPGQPKVIKIGDLTPDQRAQAAAAQRRSGAGGDYFYKPGWTTAYWPTKDQAGAIDPAAALPGSFALSSSYTGNVTLPVPDDVNFLDPFDLTSPKLSAKPDLTKFLDFQWKPIPSLLGANAMMMGFEGKNTMIIWSSSEVEDYPHMGGYLQMAEVRQMVADRKFMGPDQTQVYVPEGIFAKATMPMLMMNGWGKGTAIDAAQPLPRLQTKVSLMLTMGMPGGRGMPAMPPGADGGDGGDN